MKKNYIKPETENIQCELTLLSGFSKTSTTGSSDNDPIHDGEGKTEDGEEGDDVGAKFHHNWSAWETWDE